MIVDHHLRELLDFVRGAALCRELSEIDFGRVDNGDVVNEVLGILTGDVGGTARPDSGRLAPFTAVTLLPFPLEQPADSDATTVNDRNPIRIIAASSRAPSSTARPMQSRGPQAYLSRCAGGAVAGGPITRPPGEFAELWRRLCSPLGCGISKEGNQ